MVERTVSEIDRKARLTERELLECRRQLVTIKSTGNPRGSKIWIDDMEVKGVVSYTVERGVGDPLTVVTIKMYASVHMEAEDG